jgi:competence protein ComEC
VAAREPPPCCAATVVGRSTWREYGAITLSREGSGFLMESTRPPNFDRPWAPREPRTGVTAGPEGTTSAPATTRSPPRDATPRSEDLEADD